MKKIKLFIFFLIINNISFGQSKYQLFGEVKKNEKVSLLWIVDEYDSNLDGVNFKKRVKGSQSWETLNKSLLKQYNQLDKSLNNVSNNQSINNDLEKKRLELVNSTNNSDRLNLITQEELTEYLVQTPGNMTLLMLMFMYDYDRGLIYGYGYEDFSISKKQKIEYGLFTVINGEESQNPVAIFEANTSENLDLDIEPISSKIKRKGKNILLTLDYDGEYLDSKTNFVGFDIYRKENGKNRNLITEKTIWLDKSSNTRVLFYKDEIIDKEINYTYEIIPVSLFKNTGKPKELIWSKSKDLSFWTPELLNEQDKNTDFIEKGVKLKWAVPEDLKENIKGFIVQRKIDNGNFESISDTLNNSVTLYQDSNLKTLEYKVTYRLVVKPVDSYEIWSDELKLYYLPKPTIENDEVNLTLQPNIVNGEVVVDMKWNSISSDKMKGYIIYCDRSGGILARERGIGYLTNSNYTYKVEGVTGKKYSFTVKYADNLEIVYDYSDTVKVILPSLELPTINIWPFSVNESSITIEWSFPEEIQDLKEFIVFINDKEFTRLDKNLRTYTFENLEAGAYKISMVATSIYEVESKKSKVRTLKVL
ncbi:hypothetical protein MY04_3362 [Flammeovirga sp. MY04]|uniref:hypothetical protein n=1 Tax=Flammeovirga sp. MY04 TaxID=1191459 RepID=UPI0008062504|nr:hypothetical protein [Flammeovirga sp. MY04]ANQ50724.1 hypothetical protein MY04_3362 [Flammeovirga sp. MY04]